MVNSAGVSAFSPTALLTTDDASPPGAPTALVQTTLWANRADLRWEAPPDGGAVIALYELEVYNGTIGRSNDVVTNLQLCYNSPLNVL